MKIEELFKHPLIGKLERENFNRKLGKKRFISYDFKNNKTLFLEIHRISIITPNSYLIITIKIKDGKKVFI
jgi:hypothetical protein